MRAVVQRVCEASVCINGGETRKIGAGLVLFVGIARGDDEDDVAWLTRKIASLRIFEDSLGKTNLSIAQCEGEVLAVSQFTLLAGTRKGNRPSFDPAAPPNEAQPLYNTFVAALEDELGKPVCTGEFAASMQVSLINDGPFTLVMDSRVRE